MSGSVTRPDWGADIADLARRLGILERRTTPAPTPAGPIVAGSGGDDAQWNLPGDLKIVGQFIVTGNSLIPVLSGDVSVGDDLTVGGTLTVGVLGGAVFHPHVDMTAGVTVSGGYVFATDGVIIVAPDGGWWAIRVANDGTLSTEDMGP